jgi:LacI family transcriptional regulator
VARATRDKVHEAVAQLRFTPNRLGVSLASGEHAANGIVFPDLSGPYYAEVLLGYEAAAAELRRSVLVLSTHGREAADGAVLQLAARVDGLVVLGRTVSDAVLAEVVLGGTPVVTLARPPVLGGDSVDADNTGGGLRLGEHLAAHCPARPDGRREAVLVGDPEASPDVAARWRALLGGPLAGAGTMAAGGFDVEAGRRAGDRLVRAGLPRAVVAANDEIALGVLDAVRAGGARVPEDVLVTGWDDVMAARWAGLTTVRQPMRDLGARAARLLDRRIRGDDAAPRHEVLPTELVVRTSCGPHHPGHRKEPPCPPDATSPSPSP